MKMAKRAMRQSWSRLIRRLGLRLLVVKMEERHFTCRRITGETTAALALGADPSAFTVGALGIVGVEVRVDAGAVARRAFAAAGTLNACVPAN